MNLRAETRTNLKRYEVFESRLYNLIINMIDMVFFYYKNICTVQFSFRITWLHSYKVVQQAVPIIGTHINDMAWIMILNIKCMVGKVLKCKYNKWIDLLRKIWSHNCNGVCKLFFHTAIKRVFQFVCTHRCCYETIFFKKNNQLHKYLSGSKCHIKWHLNKCIHHVMFYWW